MSAHVAGGGTIYPLAVLGTETCNGPEARTVARSVIVSDYCFGASSDFRPLLMTHSL